MLIKQRNRQQLRLKMDNVTVWEVLRRRIAGGRRFSRK
jgi:hypothetical protein